MYQTDKRTVITLDAGGTNFVFGAIRGNQDVIKPISLPSNSHDLGQCLETLERGFREVINALDEKPVAISFAFPGPADYPNGIIGGYLPNFPSFRDGVALGPFWKTNSGYLYLSTTTQIYWDIPGEPDSDSDLPSTDKCTSEITLVWRLSA